MRRNSIFLLTLLSLLLWGAPVRAGFSPVRTGPAPQNRCAEQVFRGVTLVTFDYGASYAPINAIGAYTLRNIYACPITAPVTLGTYQPLGFRADQIAFIVWSSPDGKTFYVHRGWQIFALSAAQWQQIVGAVKLKVAH